MQAVSRRQLIGLTRDGLLLGAVLVVVACSPAAAPGPSAAARAPASPSAAPSPTMADSRPAATPAATQASGRPTQASGQSLRFKIDPTQSEARYRVREQLAGRNLPNDAVGSTKAINGELILRPDATFAEGSKVTVDLQTLRSDEGRRDRFIAGNTLQTAKFPQAEFVPLQIEGLALPLPSSGPNSFQLVGRMTIHGVEKTVTWDVEGTLTDGTFVGKAKTRFKFADFGMQRPQAAVVLSVEDDIALELDIVAPPAEG